MNEQTAATNPGSQAGAIPLWNNPRRFDPFVRRFYRLAAAWKTETRHLSNLTGTHKKGHERTKRVTRAHKKLERPRKSF